MKWRELREYLNTLSDSDTKLDHRVMVWNNDKMEVYVHSELADSLDNDGAFEIENQLFLICDMECSFEALYVMQNDYDYSSNED